MDGKIGVWRKQAAEMGAPGCICGSGCEWSKGVEGKHVRVRSIRFREGYVHPRLLLSKPPVFFVLAF